MEYLTLNNGVRMPMLGYGTWDVRGAAGRRCIREALEVGYRLLDTARMYENEDIVGQAVRESGLSREDVFITTKLYRPSAGYEKARRDIEGSLRALGTDYIDLLLIHQPAGNYLAGYRQMEKAYQEGKVRAIGLSNFSQAQIQEILDNCKVRPAVLQTEVHPYNQEKALKQFLAEQAMVIQAWYPLGHGDKALIDEPLFTQLAGKYGKSNAQIILRWQIQSGNIVIPGSKNPSHIRDNFDLFDFELTDGEMAQIAAMDQARRYYTSTPELLRRYVEMVPDVDGQK